MLYVEIDCCGGEHSQHHKDEALGEFHLKNKFDSNEVQDLLLSQAHQGRKGSPRNPL